MNPEEMLSFKHTGAAVAIYARLVQAEAALRDARAKLAEKDAVIDGLVGGSGPGVLLHNLRAELAEARKATSKLIGSALAVRKRNTTEFMASLAEDLNIAEASIGGSDQCKFNGDGFVVSRAAMPTGEAQDATK